MAKNNLNEYNLYNLSLYFLYLYLYHLSCIGLGPLWIQGSPLSGQSDQGIGIHPQPHHYINIQNIIQHTIYELYVYVQIKQYLFGQNYQGIYIHPQPHHFIV